MIQTIPVSFFIQSSIPSEFDVPSEVPSEVQNTMCVTCESIKGIREFLRFGGDLEVSYFIYRSILKRGD